MKFLSPAKLNLNLKVISKRNDGYHNLETTFQLINLFDEISFEESDKSFGISCDGLNIEPENNLIFKSLNAITNHCNLDKGIQIHLKKIIPAGAGLGGGSSNAATVLIALNKIWNLNLSTEELVNIGISAPKVFPILANSSLDKLRPQVLFNAIRVVAALELPPPSPAPTGITFFK